MFDLGIREVENEIVVMGCGCEGERSEGVIGWSGCRVHQYDGDGVLVAKEKLERANAAEEINEVYEREINRRS